MRTLTFSTNDEQKYNLIYEAFTVTERPFRGGDLRICAKVFDKLESLGKYNEEKVGRTFFIFDKPGTIKLEEPEYKILTEAIQAVSWNSLGARKAAPVIEWLEGIKEDNTPLKVI